LKSNLKQFGGSHIRANSPSTYSTPNTSQSILLPGFPLGSSLLYLVITFLKPSFWININKINK
jgi:hypothetical protein